MANSCGVGRRRIGSISLSRFQVTQVSLRSLSIGSAGSSLFLMPSRPAIIIAENARYGLHDGSGTRNSTRLALALVPVTGIRAQAERLRCEYTRLTGASKPGTSRRKELTVGQVKAHRLGAWCSRPPMYQRAMSDSPA